MDKFKKMFGKQNWMFKLNIIFVVVFLNVWDYLTSGELINGMVLGFFMFGIPMVLWLIKDFRAAMANTFLSIMEFATLLVFMVQSFEIGGAANGAYKSLFWLPYLLLAGFNAYVGLRIYSKNKAKVERRIEKLA
ncbi:hypothetical protein HY024_04040 [Candidatus Curtissbacteria bacterium]|nr:hypothetical protein [Candidatus Curtissbacteria bacterium]